MPSKQHSAAAVRSETGRNGILQSDPLTKGASSGVTEAALFSRLRKSTLCLRASANLADAICEVGRRSTHVECLRAKLSCRG